MVVPGCRRRHGVDVASYAEHSTRYPISAGEAAYVRAAFQSRVLSTTIGLLTIVTGVVSSATVTLGSAGYIQQFVDLPQGLIVGMVVLALGAVAAWGILESVVLASLFTIVEVGGLVTVRSGHSCRPSHYRDDLACHR
jgi:basic amino acid/polyamine antiporter, APA family